MVDGRRQQWLAVVFFMLVLVTPSTAAAFLYSTKDEIEIGRKVGQALERKYRLSDDQKAQERLQRLGAKIAAAANRPDIPFTFKVLKKDEINAFALPGGPVYVFQGLIDYMDDNELAGVLGHEAGHILRRHSVKQMEKAMGLTLLTMLLTKDKGVMLGMIVDDLIMAGYSRNDEREADYMGFSLTLQAGMNPFSMQMALEKLNELEHPPEYGLFSSHPETPARISLLQRYLKEARIQPEVWEENGQIEVREGNWRLTVPDKRKGYELAGGLYAVSRQADLQAEWFLPVREGENILIYYDELLVYTVTPKEGAMVNKSVEELAAWYLERFRDWLQIK